MIALLLGLACQTTTTTTNNTNSSYTTTDIPSTGDTGGETGQLPPR